MKKYKVTVNGTAYMIELEAINDGAAPAAAPAPAPAPAPSPAPAPAATGEALVAPFPGKILSVAIAPGTAVQEGQVLMVLEAMKMENEILSPRAGTIVAVNVAVGQMVETNQQLCVIQ